MTLINLIDKINKLTRYFIATLLLGMVICTLWQVLVRFLLTSLGFSIAAPWTEELARYFMIWIIFLGAGLACRRAQLIALEIIVQRLPTTLGKGLRYVAILGSVAFYALMCYLGMEFLEFGSIETSPVMGIPKNWVYWAMPIGFGLMILNTMTLLAEASIQNIDIRLAGQSMEIN